MKISTFNAEKMNKVAREVQDRQAKQRFSRLKKLIEEEASRGRFAYAGRIYNTSKDERVQIVDYYENLGFKIELTSYGDDNTYFIEIDWSEDVLE